ncbi:DUF3958 family protein [Enterococcus faecalis]
MDKLEKINVEIRQIQTRQEDLIAEKRSIAEGQDQLTNLRHREQQFYQELLSTNDESASVIQTYEDEASILDQKAQTLLADKAEALKKEQRKLIEQEEVLYAKRKRLIMEEQAHES